MQDVKTCAAIVMMRNGIKTGGVGNCQVVLSGAEEYRRTHSFDSLPSPISA
jgi:hypothetical protein